GYDAARRHSGEAIPITGVEEALAHLRVLLALHAVRRLVIAGDLFERGYDAMLANRFLQCLEECQVQFLGLVPGNHDRSLSESNGFPLLREGMRLGDWLIVHGDSELPAAPIVYGHFHPCLRWRGIAAPCFLVASNRIVLPAFSRDAAGVNVVRDRRWRGFRC